MDIRKLICFFLLLWLIISYNSEFYNMSMPVVGLGINIVTEGILLVLCLSNTLKSKLNVYKKWCIILLTFWGLSTIWSVNSDAFTSYYKFSLPYVLTFALSSLVRDKKDIEKFMLLDLIAVFLCAVYILLFLDNSHLMEERLGKDRGEGIWNANDIGLKMTIGYAIAVYYILKGSNKKILLYIISLIFLLVSFMSGSRTVIIILLMFTAVLMIARSKGNKKMIFTAYAVTFVFLSYYAVMNVPILYKIIGNRIDLMIDGLSGNSGGFSFDERSMMLAYGMEYFSNKPLLGNGFNSYSVLFYSVIGENTYSHNNFIELLANTGIIGFIIYYSLTIYILIKLWKPALRNKDTLSLVLFIYTFVTLLCDMSVVSYVMIQVIFRLMYTARYAEIIEEIESYGKESFSGNK